MTVNRGPLAAEATSESPVLSVLIVTWNSRDDVVRCLASLYREAGELPTEVIIVDNASTDETVSAIRERFPQAIVRANEANVGFPRANNQALALARGRYLLYLNPDTEIGEGTLSACIQVLDSDPEVGMVGCRLVYPNGSTQYEGARRPYRLGDLVIEAAYLHMLFPRHPLFGRQLMGEWDHLGERDVEAIMGAFMLVRHSVAREVGGLPEEVFMYHEDLAFCLRVRKAGWRIRYLGGVTTTHYSGHSSERSSAKLYLLEGEYKVRLIREGQGPLYSAAARLIFGARSFVRLVLATVAHAVPGLGRVRRRYPRFFHVQKHFLQFVWSFLPWAVAPLMPRAESEGDASQLQVPR